MKNVVLFSLIPSLTLFSFVTLRAQNPSFILKTESLQPYTPTYVSNGYFSMVSSPLGTKPTESFMVWVYDQGEGDIPRPAALPAWNEVDFFNGKNWLNQTALDNNTLRAYQQRLDMYNGDIVTNYAWADGEKNTSIEVQAFVSRSNPHLAAVKLQVIPHYSGQVKLSFPIRAWEAPRRLALAQLEKIAPYPPGPWPYVWYPGHINAKDKHAEANLQEGRLWMISEAEGRQTAVAEAVAVSWPENLNELTTNTSVAKDIVALEISFAASAETPYTFYKYAGAVSSHDAPAPLQKANQTIAAAKALGYESIFAAHTQAWHKLWETDVVVEGDPELQKVIHSMIFYLLCSVRENTEFSIPPMGLSTAGYYGHIFWDADTWMFPAILLMHPEMAKSMVMFRYRTLEAAKLNARLNGHQGAMYPWEADELGQETTPKFAYQNALYENHVTGDVALAQWQYFLATADTQWLAQYGYPVIKETADFWSSRATYDQQKDRYDIRNIVSVDEGLIGIGNDTYTNVVAKKNLEIAIAASKLIGRETNPLWGKIISRLYIPYDAQNEYHPTYENAPLAARGSVVPLLSYPLELAMSEKAKQNNLKNAARRVVENGSGAMMTITFYPIVAAELRDAGLFNDFIPRSYKGYLRPPFNVLAETPTNNSTNFITGAGGFLQQVIFGYTGLRLSEKGLAQKFMPMLPKGVTKLLLKNFSIREKKYDIVVEGKKVAMLQK
jgi:trehalose/maltose hydrolase-like predicted phosphorylase